MSASLAESGPRTREPSDPGWRFDAWVEHDAGRHDGYWRVHRFLADAYRTPPVENRDAQYASRLIIEGTELRAAAPGASIAMLPMLLTGSAHDVARLLRGLFPLGAADRLFLGDVGPDDLDRMKAPVSDAAEQPALALLRADGWSRQEAAGMVSRMVSLLERQPSAVPMLAVAASKPIGGLSDETNARLVHVTVRGLRSDAVEWSAENRRMVWAEARNRRDFGL